MKKYEIKKLENSSTLVATTGYDANGRREVVTIDSSWKGHERTLAAVLTYGTVDGWVKESIKTVVRV